MSETGKDFVIARVEPACRMLAEASNAAEAKHVADVAAAAKIYARRHKLGKEAVALARTVEVDALALMARFYQSGPKSKGTAGQLNGAGPGRGKTGSTKVEPPVSSAPTLAELGIGKKESAEGKALLELEEQAPDLFEKVRTNEFTTSKARQERARREYREGPAHTPELPVTLYRCIVADPPWPMKKSERSPRPDQGPRLAYQTMAPEAVEAMPVKELADPAGCHLYLWVTHRFLPDGLRIMAAWGFTYHCLLTWVKPTGMTPFSWMFNTEHVLFGYSGKFRCERQGLKVSFEAAAPRGTHSAKPEVFYQRVKEFSGGPRLAMFERTPREGFDAWGNELGS